MNLVCSLFLINFMLASNHPNVWLPPVLTNYKKNYCGIKCSGEVHTMCKFKHRSSSCINFTMTYSPVKAANVLHEINHERDQLASNISQSYKRIIPPASNMRLVVWNHELAIIALRWLSQCIEGHDKCRNTIDDEVGQSIAFYHVDKTSGHLPHMSFAVHEWLEEEMNVTIDDISSFNSEKSMIHNFTQIYWANLRRIGCSEVHYRLGDETIVAIACNYAPKGNIQGKPVYQAGEGCSACPRGTKCNVHESYPNLCGSRNDENDEFVVIDPDEAKSHQICSSAVVLLLALILRGIHNYCS